MLSIPGRGLVAWTRLMFWCRANPSRFGFLWTKDGKYIVRFIPKDEQVEVVAEAEANE